MSGRSDRGRTNVGAGSSGITGALTSLLRKRAPAGRPASSRPAGSTAVSESGGVFKTRVGDEDAPGLKVGPGFVVGFSSILVILVFILHFTVRF
eukprot:TRINITY_DN258_c0_g1_i2.p2 TRINITY_DN258_c0_g1~~TRINITY_DN258_c0_g1_i2.p2  ORF type:complete len:109 (+),score=35.39 TRINITY_DN258_c0_g1_i2:46-327(+)